MAGEMWTCENCGYNEEDWWEICPDCGYCEQCGGYDDNHYSECADGF